MMRPGVTQYDLERKHQSSHSKAHTEKIAHVKIEAQGNTNLHFWLERNFQFWIFPSKQRAKKPSVFNVYNSVLEEYTLSSHKWIYQHDNALHNTAIFVSTNQILALESIFSQWDFIMFPKLQV